MRKYFQYSLIYLPEGWYSCCWRRRCPPPCPTWRAAPCPGRRRPWRPPWAWLEEWGGVSWWGAGLMLSLWREEEQESTESHHMVSSVQLQPSTHSLSQDALSPPAHMSQSHSHTVTQSHFTGGAAPLTSGVSTESSGWCWQPSRLHCLIWWRCCQYIKVVSVECIDICSSWYCDPLPLSH